MATIREAIDNAKANILIRLLRPESGKTKGHLFVACGLVKGDRLWVEGCGHPHSRILDTALQELRKAGKISGFTRRMRSSARSWPLKRFSNSRNAFCRVRSIASR